MQFIKQFGWIVSVFVIFPLGAFAQYTVPLQNQQVFTSTFGAYTMIGTFNGNVNPTFSDIRVTNGVMQFKGVDPNATVTFSMKANVGTQEGLYVVSRDLNGNLIKNPDGLMGSPREATFTVSELQNRTVEGHGLEQKVGDNIGRVGATSDPIKSESNAPSSSGSNQLPFVNNTNPQNPTTSDDPYSNPENPRSPSDRPSNGGGGGSSSGEGLVPCDGPDCTLDKLKEMGANIYNYFAGFGAILAVGAIVLAGFSYIKSGGDPSEMKEAKKKIVYAITGLIILGASVLIVNTVLKVFESNTIQKVEDVK